MIKINDKFASITDLQKSYRKEVRAVQSISITTSIWDAS
jgi:hypothetical protein